MPYMISFGMRGGRDVSTAEMATAKEAWSLVLNLERSDEEIKFIRNPRWHEISRGELRKDADEEGTLQDNPRPRLPAKRRD